VRGERFKMALTATQQQDQLVQSAKDYNNRLIAAQAAGISVVNPIVGAIYGAVLKGLDDLIGGGIRTIQISVTDPVILNLYPVTNAIRNIGNPDLLWLSNIIYFSAVNSSQLTSAYLPKETNADWLSLASGIESLGYKYKSDMVNIQNKVGFLWKNGDLSSVGSYSNADDIAFSYQYLTIKYMLDVLTLVNNKFPSNSVSTVIQQATGINTIVPVQTNRVVNSPVVSSLNPFPFKEIFLGPFLIPVVVASKLKG
jgi:hypothetical protein